MTAQVQKNSGALAASGDLQVLVVGVASDGDRESLRYAASRASATISFCDDEHDAETYLSDAACSIGCIMVLHDANLAHLSQWVRDRPGFFAVPIIAFVSHPSDVEFRRAYADGADDALVVRDLGGTTRRLANLRNRPIDARPPANQGLAVIGFPDTPRRRVLGRSLRQAGFDVSFAADAPELMRVARSSDKPTLVVVNPHFPPDGGAAAIANMRAALGEVRLPAIILPANEAEDVGFEGETPSEQAGKLLFFAEEALRGDVRDLRASPRILHYALCAFREAGSLYPVFGLTHNISRQGLYVRTLDPPRPGSTLWFEMRAPGSQVAIHLRGKVVWRREPNQMGGAAPPGFGMRIEEMSCAKTDLDHYESGYDHLCQQDTGDMGFQSAVDSP